MERSPSQAAAPGPRRLAFALIAGLGCLALLLALLAGLDAGPELLRQRYPQQGLWSLSAEIVLRALRGSLPLASAGAVLAGVLVLASPRLARWAGSPAAAGPAAACALALVAIGLWAARSLPEAPSSSPNVLLVSVDTLRADHLGAYGYARPTSPAIDRLAAEGVLFRHAVSQAQWTLPSMASLHSGLYPSQHAAYRADTRLGPSVLMLAEVLRDAGYHTLAVVSHFFVASRYGFQQGMEVFDEGQILGHAAVTSEGVTHTAARLLRERGGDPFFLWVHYFDPHFDYVRHPEFGFAGRSYMNQVSFEALLDQVARLRRQGEARPDHPYMRDLKATYDEEVAYTDLWIGHLVDQVRSASSGRPLVIFLTADHGEGFLDRGQVGHARELYEELIHVPLIVAGDVDPRLRGREVSRTVETASIPRTVLRLAGIEKPHFPGEDLLAVGPQEPRPAFSEGSFAWNPSGRRRAVMLDGWKLIHDLDDGSHELYHLAADPDERRNRWGDPEAGTVQARLQAELERLSGAGVSPAEPIELGPEERQMLHQLGYVEEEGALRGSDPARAAPGPPPD